MWLGWRALWSQWLASRPSRVAQSSGMEEIDSAWEALRYCCRGRRALGLS